MIENKRCQVINYGNRHTEKVKRYKTTYKK